MKNLDQADPDQTEEKYQEEQQTMAGRGEKEKKGRFFCHAFDRHGQKDG